jgi:predicted Zn-dependent peptidase
MMPDTRRCAASGAVLTLIAALAAVVLLVACAKDTEEVQKFPSTETATALEPGELTSFKLANGITVFLREERSRPRVGVEVLFRGGVIHEGAGKTHVSRILPHMLIFSPTASFGADGAVDAIEEVGRVNGEVSADFAHFDYVVPSDQLELVLKVEAERITSVEFNEQQLKKYAKKCADDLDTVLKDHRLSLTKYGLMAFNQLYNYGKTSIPIYSGVYKITSDDLERYRRARYRPENMVIVVVGDFDPVDATALVKKYFENIPEMPDVSRDSRKPLETNRDARWDIDASVMFLVFPGPYENEAQKLALTIFGTFLLRQLMNNVELSQYINFSSCSSQNLAVDEMPFFVFVEAKRGGSMQDIHSALLLVIDESMRGFNEKMFGVARTNLIRYAESSVLDAQLNVASVPHFQVLGQAALGIGAKHYFQSGRSAEEFVEALRAISYEDAKSYLESTLILDNMREFKIMGRGRTEG